MNIAKLDLDSNAFKTGTEFSKPENMQAGKKEKENGSDIVLEVKEM
jgi:hypothetical protein